MCETFLTAEWKHTYCLLVSRCHKLLSNQISSAGRAPLIVITDSKQHFNPAGICHVWHVWGFLLWNKSKVRAMEEISPLSWLSCSTGIMPLAWDVLIGTQENHFTSELMQVVSKSQHCWPLFSLFRPHISFSVSPYSFATLHTNRPMKCVM